MCEVNLNQEYGERRVISMGGFSVLLSLVTKIFGQTGPDAEVGWGRLKPQPF